MMVGILIIGQKQKTMTVKYENPYIFPPDYKLSLNKLYF